MTKKQIFIDASALKNSSCFRRLWYNIVEGYKFNDGTLNLEVSSDLVVTPVNPDAPEPILLDPLLLGLELGKESKLVNKIDDIKLPVDTLTPRDYKMAYGSAFHIFLEDYYSLKPTRDCIDRAIAYYNPYNEKLNLTVFEFRTNTNLLKSMLAYKNANPRLKAEDTGQIVDLNEDDFHPHTDSLGKKKIEYKFAIPIWGNAEYDLFLAGTIDMICSYGGYATMLVDHKTSSLASFDKANVDRFFNPYVMDIQTMLYCKVYKELNNLESLPPILINGIFLKKPTKKANVFDGVYFARSPIFEYSDWQMEWFQVYLSKKLNKLVTYLSNNGKDTSINPIDDYEQASCKGAYGMCEYFAACSMVTPQFRDMVFASKYIKKQYNPLKFRD